jgi:hypothetical protein
LDGFFDGVNLGLVECVTAHGLFGHVAEHEFVTGRGCQCALGGL